MTGQILRSIYWKKGLERNTLGIKIRFTVDYLVLLCKEIVIFIKLTDISDTDYNCLNEEDNVPAKILNLRRLLDTDDVIGNNDK